jgi:hypothetical protein
LTNGQPPPNPDLAGEAPAQNSPGLGQPDAPASAIRRPKRKLVGWLVVAGVAVSLLAGLAVGKGFDQRKDVVEVAAGAEIDCRSVVFRFDSATAQPGVDILSEQENWKILVYGTVRNPNTGNVPVFSSSYPNIAATDPDTQTTKYPNWAQLGQYDREPKRSTRSMVYPGNEWMPVVFSFEFPGEYQPAATLPLSAGEMEFTDIALWGLGSDPVWNYDSYGKIYRTYLPLTLLPPQ